MKKEHWDALLCAAGGQQPLTQPVALIADSPWIPGYTGVNTLDYLTDLPTWWNCQRKIREDFPEVIFLPDFWVEFGMAAEPSGFGCRVSFFGHQPPAIAHLVDSCDDIGTLAALPAPNPLRDGLLPLAVNYYKRAARLAREAGEDIKMVAARGPLNIATHMMGVTEFLMAMKLYPDETQKLLGKLAQFVKSWLSAQAEAVGGAEGILLLDDIIGFLSPEDFEAFVFPYYREIFNAFPVPVRMLHNDTHNPTSYHRLEDMGVNMFNFTHELPLAEARALVGEKLCLVGNVAPLAVLTKGSAQEVEESTTQVLNAGAGKGGFILSAGGGASPGMPGDNLQAMLRAARQWPAGHGAGE